MRKANLHLADKALAEGDYVKAAEFLERASPTDPEVQRMLQTSLHRLKIAATREMTAGRWTVAEGIFDVLTGYQHRLSPPQRAEMDLLTGELCRLRGMEENDAKIHAATSMAANGLHAEARHMAYQAMKSCEDAHLVGRMRNLLQGLPHPDGRLLLGFDSPYEVRLFCRVEAGASVKVCTDPNFIQQGCSAELHFSGVESRVILLDVPIDWTSYSELNFWMGTKRQLPAEYIFMIGDGKNWFTFFGETSSEKLVQVRLPLDIFRAEGQADWTNIKQLVLAAPGPGPVNFHLDEVRLKPKET